MYCIYYCHDSYCGVVFCLFFKQKTAYELRISDWSSDVCSSDLVTWTMGYKQNADGTPQLSADGRLIYDTLYAYGARSFSIRDADGRLVWDSGEIGRAACRERVCKYV